MSSTQNVFQKKVNAFAAFHFLLKKQQHKFGFPYRATRYTRRADSVPGRAWNHSLYSSSGSRAHLSCPAVKKGQCKIAFLHHAPKSIGHSLLKLSLSHICSFLKIHSAPAETRSHRQSSHADGVHRNVWTTVKNLRKKGSRRKSYPSWSMHSPTYKISWKYLQIYNCCESLHSTVRPDRLWSYRHKLQQWKY